ncbi:MAG TPA: four-carbon acid sugar kinase family protein [Rubrobacteraceae bacterium]|nr:four-carbon acid sugar kinase family protein [Rubrobacteraceae bacterium]
MEIAVIADDLTGAADTGVQLTRAGYRTAVAFREAEMPPAGALDAVALDTDSRTMPLRTARERVSEAGGAVRDARIVYKKIDSTLRGHVAAEISAALEATGRERAVVAPAFPASGRTTVGGVQLVHGVPVHETEMRNDPRTPVREGHIPTLLAESFPSVETLSVEDLADPASARRTIEDAGCVVADAVRDGDLEALVRVVPDPSDVLWTGSAGLAGALGAVYPGSHVGATPASTPARAVVVVIGSLSGVARDQLRGLVEEYGEVAVPVEARRDGVVEKTAEAARRVLSEKACVILHSPEKRDPSGGAGPVVTTLAKVAARLSKRGLFDALVLTGGSTAVGVARRLGASGIRLEGEVEAGVPVGTLIGNSPYRVVTKAGGFGRSDTLVRAVEMLLDNGKD